MGGLGFGLIVLACVACNVPNATPEPEPDASIPESCGDGIISNGEICDDGG